MREEAVLFGKTRSLVGIITDPPAVERDIPLPAILLLNAGVIHRVGPSRLYVKIARSLAAMGFVVLRFDLSGIGDSPVRDDHLPFGQSAVSETQEAMDALSAARGMEQFLLIGICLGAMISLTTAYSDPRVVGVVSINAEAHHLQSLEDREVMSYMTEYKAAQTYWKIVLGDAKVWLKAITGRADYRKMVRWTIRTIDFHIRSKAARQRRLSSKAPQVTADLRTLTERGVRLLFVYTVGDFGLDYCRMMFDHAMRTLSTGGKLRIEIIAQADHTFTLLANQAYLLHTIRNWAYAMVQD